MSSSKSQVSKMWDDIELRPYLGEVRRRHGIVETLALPSMRDLPPVQIENLFVSPLMATSAISADSDPGTWPQGRDLLDELREFGQIVLLGDPGGGKTTLSNWLAWRLATGLTSPLPPELEGYIPIPCILREMPASFFSQEVTLSDLAVNVAVNLLGSRATDKLKASIRSQVERGFYVLIFDGVDEIPVSQRRVVAGWMQVVKQQSAFVLATSRIVGYEDSPIDRESSETAKASASLVFQIEEKKKFAAKQILAHGEVTPPNFGMPDEDSLASIKNTRGWAEIRYLMPFDKSRICAFVQNWYHQRCGTAQEAQQRAGDLLASLAQSDVTQKLARTPNLLSLMAIVHRERAHLPDGKALLYDEIANAYINTIDRQRKIDQGDTLAPYGWKERKAWLAYVGFKMQCGRGHHVSNDTSNSEAGVLVDESDVLAWLTEAMSASGVLEPEQAAKTYLSWVARRSGLLLPRGEGRYAFVHLSFQEYFCACYLDTCIVSPAFIRDKLSSDSPVTKEKIRAWSGVTEWGETLVYLFELLSAERDSDWVEDLAGIVFGDIDADVDLLGSECALAARLLKNRHIRLGRKWVEHLANCCSEIAFSEWSIHSSSNESSVLHALIDAGFACLVQRRGVERDENQSWISEKAIDELGIIKDRKKIRVLIIDGVEFSSLDCFAELVNLRGLVISESKICDLSPLSSLKNLKSLVLSGLPVTDLSPLMELNKLQICRLSSLMASSLHPLSKLSQLRDLSVYQLDLKSLAPVSEMKNLHSLTLFKCGEVELPDLKGLKKLSSLLLFESLFAEQTPVLSSSSLKTLYLAGSVVDSFKAFEKLRSLEMIYVMDSQVRDVSPLSKLLHLRELHIASSNKIDLKSFSKLKQLRALTVRCELIKDVSPLSKLESLTRLEIYSPQVVDVSAVSNLKNLYYLNIAHTGVTNLAPLLGMESLRYVSVGARELVDTAGLEEQEGLSISYREER